MNIKFSRKEEKTDKFELSQINFCYLIAICDQNPNLWNGLKNTIKLVEEKIKED